MKPKPIKLKEQLTSFKKDCFDSNRNLEEFDIFFGVLDEQTSDFKKKHKALMSEFRNNVKFNRDIDSLYPNAETYSEKIFLLYYDLDDSKHTCWRCGGRTPFIQWSKGYKSNCCEKETRERLTMERETSVTKICVNCNNEYTTTLWLNSDTCSKKCANAKWRRDYPEEVAATQRKREATCLEKYGDKNVVNSKYTRDITKEKLGVEYPWQSKQIRDDINQRRFDQFGYYVATQNPEVAARISATRIERYGDNLPQLHKYKEYIFPSGKSYKVQGYEPQAIDFLLKIYYEEDIILGRNEMLRVAGARSFEYDHENKTRSYYPDIFIKSKNLFIEVKSQFTFDMHKDTVFLKQNVVKANGYNHKILIFHPNGELIRTI